MSNIVLDITSALQNQNIKSDNPLQDIDLNDNTFSNILNNKLEDSNESNIETNIIDKLGMPIGLNIDGFDYVSNNIEIDTENSIEQVNKINSDNNIQSGGDINIDSLLSGVKNSISSVFDNTFNNDGNSGFVQNSLSKLLKNQITSIYNSMDKEVVNDLSGLISKL